MFSSLRLIRQLHAATQRPDASLRASIVVTDAQLKAAKALHARVFLDRGYVRASDLVDGGKAIGPAEDPYQTHATYFVVERLQPQGRVVVATARLIHATPQLKHNSFQTLVNQRLNQSQLTYLQSLDPARCVEVSGLVKAKGESTFAVMMLYRAMWQYSIVRGYKLWLMSCDEGLYRKLKTLFGDTLVAIGRPTFFKGHHVVPAMLELDHSIGQLLSLSRYNVVKRQAQMILARFFLHGLPASCLHPEHHNQLRNHNIKAQLANSHE